MEPQSTDNVTIKESEVIQESEVSESCEPVEEVTEPVEVAEVTEVSEETEVTTEAKESENAAASVSEVPEKQVEEPNQKEPKPEVVKIVSNQQKLYESARETWSKLSDECLAIIRSAIDLLRSSSSDVVKEVLDDRKVCSNFFRKSKNS